MAHHHNVENFIHTLTLMPIPNGAGHIANANIDNFPALNNMAVNRLSMNPGTLNSPHWHTNSDELVYIISGKALFGIRGLHGEQSIFTAKAGEMVFIERNYLHYFKSIDPKKNLEVGVWFNTDKPDVLTLADTLAKTNDSIVAQAFEVDQSVVDLMDINPDRIMPGTPAFEVDAVSKDSRFKFKLKNNGRADVLAFDGPDSGQIRIVDPSVFPALKDFTVAYATLKPGAMRQIHWHQHANELNLTIKGTAEFGMLTPEGQSFAATVKPDDAMMAPLGYPHYIKNTGESDFHFVLAFDHADIAGVDVRGGFEAVLDSVKRQTFGEEVPYEEFVTDSASLVPPLNGRYYQKKSQDNRVYYVEID